MSNPLFNSTNDPIKVYWFPISGHAHRAQLMLTLLDIPHEIIPMDLANGAHKTPEFLKLHPFGLVPVIDDNGTIVWDSNAILVYLASKYDEKRSWLPTDATTQGHIQQWLSTATSLLVSGPGAARLVKVFGSDHDYDKAVETAKNVLSVFEDHLSKNDYLVGGNATIADISAYSYIAHAPEGGIDLSPYPSLNKWLARVEALPKFVGMKPTEV
mgnify:CR=1 FL=1